MSSVNKDAKTLYYRYFVYSQEEEAMREQRIKDIRYLIDKCEQIIREEAKAHE